MSSRLAAQYPHISYPHCVYLAKRQRGDREPILDHTAILRAFLALIIREEGFTPETALRVAREKYPDARP